MKTLISLFLILLLFNGQASLQDRVWFDLDELSFDYTYDPNKNVGGEASTGIMSDYSWTASFDAADRIKSWNRPGTAGFQPAISTQSWNLDLIGNWDSVTTNSVTENRTHNDVHELTDIDGQAATYDDKGNLLTLPGTVGILPATLTWDIDNHLSSVTHSQNGVTNFTYDAIGRRVSKNDTLFVSHGQRVIEEYTYQPSTDDYQLSTSYIHGTYVDDILAKVEAGSTGVPPVVHYYHTDRQYNVRGLTDASGNIVELYAYTVYGKQTVMDGSGVDIGATAHNNNYGFTGRYLDSETGLWYFRARYFSDELGRFISRDPTGYVDGYGLYNGYFAQVFAMDPMGMWTVRRGPFSITVDVGKWDCSSFDCDKGKTCTQKTKIELDLSIGGVTFEIDSKAEYLPNSDKEGDCKDNCTTNKDINFDYGLIDPYASVTGTYENNCSKFDVTARLDINKVSLKGGWRNIFEANNEN